MKLHSILLAMGAAAGSATATPTAHANPKPRLSKAADANLEKLRALKVFEVHRLVIDIPANAYSCYGWCPGAREKIEEDTKRATAKLQLLTEVALRAAEQPTGKACPAKEIDANVAAINGLQVIAIGSMTDKPTAAQACERAARLANIAIALKAR
jgi:hypothetical protein